MIAVDVIFQLAVFQENGNRKVSVAKDLVFTIVACHADLQLFLSAGLRPYIFGG